MRLALAPLTLACALAAPAAHATGGYHCETPDGSAAISTVIGRAVPQMISARLDRDGETSTTQGEGADLSIGQSWLDDRQIMLDLVDPQALTYIARLRVLRSGGPLDYGYVTLGDETFPVTCETDG